MLPYQFYQFMAVGVPLMFVFAFGACVGSLINVIAYRLPLGIGIVSPPSRCPSCGTRLTFRENIPVFGWLLLRGRCRFCQAKISPEYPIVEAITGVLFALCYWLLVVLDHRAELWGIPIGLARPEWAHADFRETWPTVVLWLTLLGSLVAMTIVDFKTYTIPLVLTWVPAIAALVIHPVHAAVMGPIPEGLNGWGEWSLPLAGGGSVGWGLLYLSVAAMIGLGISLWLVESGKLARSFADYDEWEASVRAERGDEAQGEGEGEGEDDAPPVGAEGDPELWIEYPHARREVLNELLFLAPCLALGYLGFALATRFGLTPSGEMPYWARVLAGVLLGYLAGGAVIWGVRIFGSLAFGREAMGLGDVHVLAAVGACLGWIDGILTFFAAVLVGLFGAIVGSALSAARGGKAMRMMAFGPCLAMGAVLVVVGKPLIEIGLGMLLHRDGPIDLP